MRPIFTVHAGEFLVGTQIEQKFKGTKHVWVPTKDTGVDLLVTNSKNQNSLSLQVKFSKDFLPIMNLPLPVQKELRACSWFSLDRKKIEHSLADLWVFVLLGFAKRSYDYVLIDPDKLLKTCDKLDRNSKRFQIYIWVTNREKCWLTRGLSKIDHKNIGANNYTNDDRDLTPHLNDWHMIQSL